MSWLQEKDMSIRGTETHLFPYDAILFGNNFTQEYMERSNLPDHRISIYVANSKHIVKYQERKQRSIFL